MIDYTTAIKVSGTLLPDTQNTPLDIRTRVSTLSEIADIENPFVGMIIYVIGTDEYYHVVTLRDVQSGLSTIKRIDTYALFVSGGTSDAEITKPFVQLENDEYFSQIWLDGGTYKYSIYKLYGSSASDYNSDITLNIVNTNVNDYGEILLIQKAYHKVLLGVDNTTSSIAKSLIGNVDMTLNEDSVTLLKWTNTENGIYIEPVQLWTNIDIPEVNKITGFKYTFYDNNMCQLTWYSPTTHNETVPADLYELSYSKQLLTETQAANSWLSLQSISNLPTPSAPGEIETVNIFGLQPQTTYYFYIRAKKVYKGATNTSVVSTLTDDSSNIIGITTTGSLVGSIASGSIQSIPLKVDNFIPMDWDPAQVNTINGQRQSGIATMVANNTNALYDAENASDGAYPTLVGSTFENGWVFSQYSKSYVPFYVTIDLFQKYSLTRMYMCTSKDTSTLEGGYSIYVKENLDSEWQELGSALNTSGGNNKQVWDAVDLTSLTGSYRFIKIGFDRFTYAYQAAYAFQFLNCDSSAETKIMSDSFTAAMPFSTDNGYGSNPYMTTIFGMLLYGYKATDDIPVGIAPARRRLFTMPTLGNVFNLHNQGYMSAKLATLLGGPYVRSYFSGTNFSIFNSPSVASNNYITFSDTKKSSLRSFSSRANLHSTTASVRQTAMSDLKFILQDNSWVIDQGTYTGKDADGSYRKYITLQDHLKYNYSKYGAKPYITLTSGLVEISTAFSAWDDAIRNNVGCDSWYSKAATSNQTSTPLPTYEYRGWLSQYNVEEDPTQYGIISKFVYCIVAKYGSKTHSTTTETDEIFFGTSVSKTSSSVVWQEDKETGLDLISGIEYRNEPDGYKNYTFCRHKAPTLATIESAISDGTQGLTNSSDYSLSDYYNGYSYFGAKNADKDIYTFGCGRASTSAGQLFDYYQTWLKIRSSQEIDTDTVYQMGVSPLDYFCTHAYFTTIGTQGQSYTNNTIGTSITLTRSKLLNESLFGLEKIRDRYLPKMQLCCNEFGWGESGMTGLSGTTQFQLMSLPQYTYYDDATAVLPPINRSDLKGYFTVSGSIELMNAGFSMMNYYMLDDESDYFAQSDANTGPGFEMFHWDDVSDSNKLAYINSNYRVSGSGSSFDSTSLFGNGILNGFYPITRAAWIIRTYYQTLKDYTFIGMKEYTDASDFDNRVSIGVFKKVDTDGTAHGAYVVWYNDYADYSENWVDVNRGRKTVQIALPIVLDGSGNPQYSVTKVRYHIPSIPNPQAIPWNTQINVQTNGSALGTWAFTGNYYQSSTENSNASNKIYAFTQTSGATGTTTLGCLNRNRSILPTSRRERYNTTTSSWENCNIRWGDSDNQVECYVRMGETIADDSTDWIYKSYTCSDGDIVQERLILPTVTENPYFPIVGPVLQDGATGAGNYVTGTDSTNRSTDYALFWRQQDAIYDYVMFTNEGKRGSGLYTDPSDATKNSTVTITSTSGDGYTSITNSKLQTDATLKPVIYLFDGSPEITFNSQVSDLTYKRVNSTTIELWWNNNDVKDSAYAIYKASGSVSIVTDLTYLQTSVVESSGITQNKAVITGLTANTTYSFAVTPIYGYNTTYEQYGTISDIIIATTSSQLTAPVLTTSVQTLQTIQLNWTFDTTMVPTSNTFVGYEVYRWANDDASDKTIIALVDDITTLTYLDSGLSSGKMYNYILRARLNDTVGTYYSEYSSQLTTSTKTEQTSDGVVQSGYLNTDGNQIVLVCDIILTALSSTTVSDFTLTQGGVTKTISSILIDSGSKYIYLNVSSSDFTEYNEMSVIRLNYTGTSVKTYYSNNILQFANLTISNNYGKTFDYQFPINFRTSSVTTYVSGETTYTAPNPTGWNTAITGNSLYTLYDYTDSENEISKNYTLSFITGNVTISSTTYNSSWLTVTDLEGACSDINSVWNSPYGKYTLSSSRAADPVLSGTTLARFNASSGVANTFDYTTYSVSRAGYNVYTGSTTNSAILKLSGLEDTSQYTLRLLTSNCKTARPLVRITYTNGSTSYDYDNISPNTVQSDSSCGQFVTCSNIYPQDGNIYIILRPATSSTSTANSYNYLIQCLVIEETKAAQSTGASQTIELRDVSVEEVVTNYETQYSE